MNHGKTKATGGMPIRNTKDKNQYLKTCVINDEQDF